MQSFHVSFLDQWHILAPMQHKNVIFAIKKSKAEILCFDKSEWQAYIKICEKKIFLTK